MAAASLVLIRAALRDEGTSTHYLPPARWARAPDHLLTAVTTDLPALRERVIPGRSWTTDAPYRETPSAISRARDTGADCVEMESAARYAYAAARGRDVLCLAHVTNTMAVSGDDFEKGHANGALAAIAMTAAIAQVLQARLGRQAAGFDVVETERRKVGTGERIHAVKAA